MHLEMLLYHGIDATASISISMAYGGPWTTLTLTSTKTITEALAEWETLANAALPLGLWSFSIEPGYSAITLASGAGGYIRVSHFLRQILGSWAFIGPGDYTSYLLPHGYLTTMGGVSGADELPETPTDLAVGLPQPRDFEDSELYEFRGGRASSLHYNRVGEVEIDIAMSAAAWEAMRGSPMLSGHAAFKLVLDEEDPFAEATLDGSLVCYPIELVSIEQDSPEDIAIVRLRCSVRDPDAAADAYAPGASTDSLWRRFVGGLPYGYSLGWIARAEGIPTLFTEVNGYATAPTGYDLDASLVIDRCPMLGSVVHFDDAVAKGFDGEVRLLDSSVVRTYMRRPERITYLTTALDGADTTAVVDNATAFEGLDELYIGTSCVTFTTITGGKTFGGLDRDAYGRSRSYPVGTIVTDGPWQWQRRRVDLFAALFDPDGNEVYSGNNDILAGAVMRWSGYVAERPVRDGTEWVLTVRDQVRELTRPIGVAASGSAVFEATDDTLVRVPTTMTYAAKVELQPTSGLILDVVVRPFSGYTDGDYARSSALRQAIVDALTAAATDPQINEFRWVQHDPVHELIVGFTPASTDLQCVRWISQVTGGDGAGFFSLDPIAVDPVSALPGSAAPEWRALRLMQPIRNTGVALSVILDDGDPSGLPTSGMVILEAGGVIDYARYTSLAVDDADPSKVNLTLDASDRILGAELEAILAGERQQVSVRFLWTDSGGIEAVLLRTLMSTGDGTNGAYDTLPLGQGLAMPMVDADSFEDVFGGLWQDLDFSIYVDAGETIADVFGGVMRLSRTALVTRCAADGTTVDIAAVDVGTVDTAVPVATITEDLLVVAQPGRRPVRVKTAYQVPQVIECTVHSAPAGDMPAGEAAITFKDPHLVDWTSAKWELDIYGIGRDELLRVGRSWARSWFRSGENRQIVEIDVVPWVDAQPGDVVRVELPDPSLWDYAQGLPGLTGLGRVLGAQMPPARAVLTLTVAMDGVYTAGPMSPSLLIDAVAGGATTPTSIDVDDMHYDLLVAAKDGNASWTVCCYKPGTDTWHLYTVSDVSLPGGGVARLTVTAYPTTPSASLAAGWRLTWPHTGNTEHQALYLHNDDARQWS